MLRKAVQLSKFCLKQISEPPKHSIRAYGASCKASVNHSRCAIYFPRGKSTEADSLIGQATTSDLSVCGMQELPLGGNKKRKFYTQSAAFKVRQDDEYESKVFTMVQMRPPQSE